MTQRSRGTTGLTRERKLAAGENRDAERLANANLVTGELVSAPDRRRADVIAFRNLGYGIPAGDNVLRVLPALTITEEEIAEGIARLDAAATALSRRAAAE